MRENYRLCKSKELYIILCNYGSVPCINSFAFLFVPSVKPNAYSKSIIPVGGHAIIRNNPQSLG